jgi:ribosomal protein S18 acetylase RimI-like enzyme
MVLYSIRELRPEDLIVAADLTARSMRDNPLDIAALGSDSARREERLRRMFRIAMPMIHKKGSVLGGFDGATLVGIAGTKPSTRCQLGLGEKLLYLVPMIHAVGFAGLARLLDWTERWAAHDLAEPHWHLGPLAVDSHLQGKGIGSALMVEYCTRLDGANAVGYLETDKPENVKFYRRFGFQTIAEAPVLNIPSWFMRRASSTTAGKFRT